MKRFGWLILLLLTLPALSGCSGLSYEELYCLPQATEDYYDLQTALSEVLSDNYTYLAPTSGTRQEPVQLVDLDGDGVDEAVAFFWSASDAAIRIQIFSKSSGTYAPAATIEGTGTSVASVEYADLDGQGDLEIILTYQVSDAVPQAMQVYHYDANGVTKLLTASCSQYKLSDLDGDGMMELFCITESGTEAHALVEYYDCVDGALQRSEEQRLSFFYDGLRRVKVGKLSDDAEGILVSGTTGDGALVTDVYCVADGTFTHVTPEKNVLESSAVHSYYVYPDDINDDGVLEVAKTVQLTAYDSGSAAQWMIRWYAIGSDGSCKKKLTTYQNFGENWYFELPDAWDGAITAKETDVSTAVSTVSFYRKATGTAKSEELLTIYSLRGTGRQSYADDNNLTILFSDSDAIYAVKLNEDAEPWEGTMTLTEVSEQFHMLSDGWSDESMIGKN